MRRPGARAPRRSARSRRWATSSSLGCSSPDYPVASDALRRPRTPGGRERLRGTGGVEGPMSADTDDTTRDPAALDEALAAGAGGARGRWRRCQCRHRGLPMARRRAPAGPGASRPGASPAGGDRGGGAGRRARHRPGADDFRSGQLVAARPGGRDPRAGACGRRAGSAVRLGGQALARRGPGAGSRRGEMLASGAPPDLGRAFGITWDAGVRLPRRELDAMFAEFTDLQVTAASVLSGRDLRAIEHPSRDPGAWRRCSTGGPPGPGRRRRRSVRPSRPPASPGGPRGGPVERLDGRAPPIRDPGADLRAVGASLGDDRRAAAARRRVIAGRGSARGRHAGDATRGASMFARDWAR